MTKNVNFEIAKLLKEKGFDEETNKYYVQVFNDVFKLTHHRMWEMDEESGFQNAPHYLAPTIAEVVMWLNEKYGIWVYSKMSFNIINDEAFDSFTPIIERRSEFDINILGDYKSPTEAYEAAIEYILNYLL